MREWSVSSKEYLPVSFHPLKRREGSCRKLPSTYRGCGSTMPPFRSIHPLRSSLTEETFTSCAGSWRGYTQRKPSTNLKDMNRAVGIDRAVVATINEIREWLVKGFDSSSARKSKTLFSSSPGTSKKIPLRSRWTPRVSH